MYVRPQLSRRKTGDRTILRAEHIQDLNVGQSIISEGAAIERDMQKLEEMVHSIQINERLSEQDRERLLEPLTQTLNNLRSDYERQVEQVLDNVIDSMEERVIEMESASRDRDKAVSDAENTIWKTKIVDKEKIVGVAVDVARDHKLLVEQSCKDLNVLRQNAEQQRAAIRKHQK